MIEDSTHLGIGGRIPIRLQKHHSARACTDNSTRSDDDSDTTDSARLVQVDATCQVQTHAPRSRGQQHQEKGTPISVKTALYSAKQRLTAVNDSSPVEVLDEILALVRGHIPVDSQQQPASPLRQHLNYTFELHI